MRCRCNDIPKMENDISTIQDIQSILQQMEERNGSAILQQCTSLSNASGGAFTPDNKADLQDAITRLNDPVKQAVSAMLSQCETKISDCQIELDDMRVEDREYHESEDDD